MRSPTRSCLSLTCRSMPTSSWFAPCLKRKFWVLGFLHLLFLGSLDSPTFAWSPIDQTSRSLSLRTKPKLLRPRRRWITSRFRKRMQSASNMQNSNFFNWSPCVVIIYACSTSLNENWLMLWLQCWFRNKLIRITFDFMYLFMFNHLGHFVIY